MKISSPSRIDATATVNEVVFIDTAIAGFQDLANGVRPGISVVLIDGNSDGLLQIAQALKAYGPLHTVHIISHGEPGTLLLGATRVNERSLGHYQDSWNAFRQALGEAGEVLLYGCEIAKGDIGKSFVARFAELAGAKVAASTELVGNAGQGGSWDLWYGNGVIAAALALTDAARANFHGVLAVLAGTFTFGSWSATISPTTADDPTTNSTIKSDGTAGTGADTGLMAQIITPDSRAAFIGTTPADWTGAGVSVLANNDGSLTFAGSSDNLNYVERIRIYAANVSDTFKLDGLNFGFKFASGDSAVTSTTVSIVGYDSTNHELGRLNLGLISGGTLKSVSPATLGLPDSGSFQNIREFALEFTNPVAAVQLDDLVIASAVTADTTAPRVTSISRQTPSSATTNADSLVYRVTFSEAVSNVDAADFAVAGSDASVTNLSPVGSNAYDVTVSGGNLASLDGTVTLGFAGGQNIADTAGNALAITIPTGTNDNTYTLDNVAPRVTSIDRHTPSGATTNADSLVYRVTFDGTVSNLDITDFTVAGTTGTVTNVSSAGGNAYDVVLSGGDLANLNGTVTLNFAGGQNITDVAGNALNPVPAGSNNNTYIVSNQPPTTTIATAAFSADTGASSTDFNTKTAAQTISGTLSANLAAGETVYVSLNNGASWTAAAGNAGQNTWSLSGQTLTGNGTLRVKVTDLAGNDGAAFVQAYALDTTVPATTVSNIHISADTGSSASDFLTSTAAQTVTASLSANLAAGDILYGSLDNGATWTNITSSVTGAAISWTGVTLAAGTSALQFKVTDAAGNDGAAATQTYTLDTAAPVFQGATVNGNTLVMTYTDAATIDAANPPASGTFAVVAGGGAIAVNGVAVNAAARTVTLTLAAAVSNGQAVTVAYSDPTNSNDANAIQDAAGNDAATLTATNVTNNTAAAPAGGGESAPATPSAPTLPSLSTVDGVPIRIEQISNSDGTTSTKITIPVIEPTRKDQSGNNTVADIPLVTGNGGAVLLTAQVPTGMGLTAQGNSVPKAAGLSSADLTREIKAHTAAGARDQDSLIGGGSGFLGSHSKDAPLLVQTIVPTMAPNSSAPSGPLTIVGTPSAPGQPMTALVIDGRSLPGGSEIRLNDIDYAAVIGQLSVTGGAGSQNVWGDGSSQYIMLGAGDDILHGGAGDDTVGSAGGNDKIFGDEGNDLVFGGQGNDAIDGGTGLDTIRLVGSGRSDYMMRVENGRLTVTHRNGGNDGVDTVASVEKINFTGGEADTTVRGIITRMYDAMFDRAPDLQGLEYWIRMSGQGLSMIDIANQFVISPEAQTLHGSQTDAQFVDALYQRSFGRAADTAGRGYWTGLLEQGKADRATLTYSFANSEEKIALEKASGYTLDFARTDVATLVRMYDTLFDRKADAAGLNHWIAVSENGMSLRDIAYGFIHSEQAVGMFGGMSNIRFVHHLYKAGLDRQGSDAEVSAWARQLDSGTIGRADALLGFADSAEKIALVGMMSTSVDTM